MFVCTGHGPCRVHINALWQIHPEDWRYSDLCLCLCLVFLVMVFIIIVVMVVVMVVIIVLVVMVVFGVCCYYCC